MSKEEGEMERGWMEEMKELKEEVSGIRRYMEEVVKLLKRIYARREEEIEIVEEGRECMG